MQSTEPPWGEGNGELELIRLELEKSRRSEEKAAEALGSQRRARLRAERNAEHVAKAMSDVLFAHLRERQGVRRWWRRQGEVLSRAEWNQLVLLRHSPYFWPGWYLRHNLDVARSGEEPALHFLRIGWKEERDPSPNFSVRRYVDAHPELRSGQINPLLHALETGDLPPLKHERHKYDS